MANTDAALSYLIEQQRVLGITGRAMAERLGMREQEWSRIKNGHRPLGPLQRERARRAFPAIDAVLYGIAS